MFYTDGQLQYPVRVERPNPTFARALQQAIGGVEGEIRVAMQYMFQAFGARGPAKYRDMLLNTATEELGHIEMLAPPWRSISKALPCLYRRRRRPTWSPAPC
jgi:Mn-containing catalase